MSGDHDDLFGMLTALQIGDHVVADTIGEFLRRKREMHADLSLGGKVGDEISIFGGDGTGGNSCRKAEAGVRQTIICVTDRTDKGGNGSELRSRPWPHASVSDGFAISDKRESGGGFLLVVNFVEQDDLAGDLFATQRFQLVEVIHDDDICSETISGRGCASAQRGENDFLRGAGNLPGYSTSSAVSAPRT